MAPFEEGIRDNIASVSTAVVMLFLIGAIGSTWMLSGCSPYNGVLWITVD